MDTKNKKIVISGVVEPPPSDYFQDDDVENIPVKKQYDNKPPQIQFENMVEQYYNSKPYNPNPINQELEVRFATRGIKPLSKIDYDNVIQKLKSLGFNTKDDLGYNSLRIQNEYLDARTGKFRMSPNIRAEIDGTHNISVYCETNDIEKIVKNNSSSVKFTKKNFTKDKKGEILRPVNFDDWNFRVSYQGEIVTNWNDPVNSFIVKKWKESKKTFRHINRVTFQHTDYPILVDISIVQNSSKEGKFFKPFNNIKDSGVFTNPKSYEIELEINNSAVGPDTRFNNHTTILNELRHVIKIVLSGLQHTNYPVSYHEQNEVIRSYMMLLHTSNYNPEKRIYNSDFIGPSSYTLQMMNISEIMENSTIPNIRNNYTVTEKADGDRHLLFINSNGMIYLINTNMNVIFTGAMTKNKDYFNSLLDGELIINDKNGGFINLFAAFDIYYINKNDVRAYSFMPGSLEKDASKCRYPLLKGLIKKLNPISYEDPGKNNISPIRISHKNFYPSNPETTNIFEACYDLIRKFKNNLFEYNTDGLIFTPAFMGVGSDKIGKAGPLTKNTWEHSFKWKPPEYNTIDFLVSTVKTTTGTDLITAIYEDGINTNLNTQLSEYKQIVLMCTFIKKKHGYMNPCQDVIDDNVPEYLNIEEEKINNKEDYKAEPVQFYPTNPYDPSAGLCNIMLKQFNNIKAMMSEENDLINDNMIVEFRYDLDRDPGWRWIPLRVRYDKTSDLIQHNSNFGNAYHVANSNWQSIHNPITEDMICTGLNIPNMIVNDDVYYNNVAGISKTRSLRDFHNLYVKKTLITAVSKKGDTLIDFACGKAGDLSKWINAKLSFVFGIDISKDNLENKLDGACARYLNNRKKHKHMPYALFVNGNSANNIKNGDAMLNDKAKQITNAVFGNGPKDENKLGKGVFRQFGKGQEGFQIASCQFALHYFFESIVSFKGFLKNVSECTKTGGYFIGACYDGSVIFNNLKNKKQGESIQILDDGKKILEIVKGYNSTTFEDNISSIGNRIDVYQESINQLIPEYLVNFDYLNRVMISYGFKLIDRTEAQELGFPEGSGSFSELYLNMVDEVKTNTKLGHDYGDALKMNAFEKRISFLNRYFIYKKVANVNVENVQLDLEDYVSPENNIESAHAIKIAEQEVKIIKPKIKKLSTKLVLTPATEAYDDEADQEVKPVEIKDESVSEEEKDENENSESDEEKDENSESDEEKEEPKVDVEIKPTHTKTRKQKIVKEPKEKTRKQKIVKEPKPPKEPKPVKEKVVKPPKEPKPVKEKVIKPPKEPKPVKEKVVKPPKEPKPVKEKVVKPPKENVVNDN
jgi:hypothetical protein